MTFWWSRWDPAPYTIVALRGFVLASNPLSSPRTSKFQYAMSKSFACVNCRKGFGTSKALSCHIANRRQCRRSWHQFLANLTPRPPSPHVHPPDVASPPINDVEMDNDFVEDMDEDGSLADISGEEEITPAPPRVLDITDEPMDWSLEPSVDIVTQATPVPSVLPGARATTEPAPSTHEDIFPEAGSVIFRGDPPFSTSADDQREHNNNQVHPFADRDDWEFASWIHESKLSMSQIDKLLHLNYVCSSHSKLT
jgi:hypothetical protein